MFEIQQTLYVFFTKVSYNLSILRELLDFYHFYRFTDTWCHQNDLFAFQECLDDEINYHFWLFQVMHLRHH